MANATAQKSPSPRPAPSATEPTERKRRSVKDGPAYRLRSALRAHIRKQTGFAPSTGQVTVEALLSYARSLKMPIPQGCDNLDAAEVEAEAEE